MRRKKVLLGAATVGVITASLALTTTAAQADYAPSSKDVVGVGSDTLQNLVDFVADGDHLGDTGYNTLGNANKLVSFDATADANARLAYSPQGVGNTPGNSATNNCAPGTGATQGTGNQNTTHTGDVPCTLNPTIVLRAGTQPVQRPNGSGAGFNFLVADTKHLADFSRASSARGSGGNTMDSITVGTDGLAMLSSSTTNAVALSTTQLQAIYNCSVTTWNDPTLGGTSSDTIKPLLPQIGSGTRTSFLSAIGVTTPGSCVTNVEENDPEAIDASGAPTDAIEPMSSGRLNLYLGKLSDGTANDGGSGIGYFKDPSCVGYSSVCTGNTTLTPNVKYWTTGTPKSGSLFNINRSLYLYFRDADINSTKVFQPGGTLNWVRTLFYNPCSGAGHTTGCVTIGGTTYGPGGAPYFATSAAQSLISAAGVVPTYAFTQFGP